MLIIPQPNFYNKETKLLRILGILFETTIDIEVPHYTQNIEFFGA